MAFLVILSSPLSPHRPRCPHIIPIAPRRSPCGPHGCGLCCVHPMLSPRSLWSPHPHIVPMSSLLSPHHPHSPQKVPMWSRWLWSPWSLLSPPHIVPMLSPWSPCRPRHPHIISMSSLSFPLHLEGFHIIPSPPDTHSTHPPPPGGWGAPNQ